MFSSYLSAEDEPTLQWKDIRNFFSSLVKGSFLAAKFLRLGSFFYAPIAGVLCAANDIYDIYSLPHDAPQRKSKIAASLLSCVLNLGFAAASFFNYFNPLNLLILGCSSVIPTLLQSAYAVDQTETELKHLRSSATIIISNINERHFQNKATTVYKIAKTISCGMIIGGFFFPPLLIAGSIILGLVATLENFDKNNNFRFAKKLANFFSSKPTIYEEDFIIPPDKSDDFFGNSINTSPKPDNTLAVIARRRVTTLSSAATPSSAVIPSAARDLPARRRSLAALGMTAKLGMTTPVTATQMTTFKPPTSSSRNAPYTMPVPSQRAPASHKR